MSIICSLIGSFQRHTFFKKFWDITLKPTINNKHCIQLGDDVIKQLESYKYLIPISNKDEEYLGVMIGTNYTVKIEGHKISRILQNDKEIYDINKVESINPDNSINARSSVAYGTANNIYFLIND